MSKSFAAGARRTASAHRFGWINVAVFIRKESRAGRSALYLVAACSKNQYSLAAEEAFEAARWPCSAQEASPCSKRKARASATVGPGVPLDRYLMGLEDWLHGNLAVVFHVSALSLVDLPEPDGERPWFAVGIGIALRDAPRVYFTWHDAARARVRPVEISTLSIQNALRNRPSQVRRGTLLLDCEAMTEFEPEAYERSRFGC